MGQKVNPRALRLKGVQEFLNNWFSLNNYSLFLIEDEKIRKYIDNKLSRAFVSKVLIRRKGSEQVILDIYTSKPGYVLGKGGDTVNALRESISSLFKRRFNINVIEEKNPDKSAKLLADLVAVQLEKRIPFRRAMKMVVQSSLKSGAEGIK